MPSACPQNCNLISQLRHIFDSWVFTWDSVPNAVPKGCGICLDLGCGDARHRRRVEEAGWSWLGLDVDASRGGATVIGDAISLPLASQCFDLVLLWQVLEHVQSPHAVLREAYRVLKPGGRVVGSVSCLEPIHDIASYFSVTHKGLELLLTDCGFGDIRLEAGLNCFSLISRSLLRRLLGASLGERAAFAFVWGTLVTSLYAYLLLRLGWNLLRRGQAGEDYMRSVRWLTTEAPLEFAGDLVFEGHKTE